MTTTSGRKIHIGFTRWIVLALVIAEVIVAGIYKPISPHVQLPSETLSPVVDLPIIGKIALTNTMVSVFIADVLLILAAVAVSRSYRERDAVPRGVAAVFEMIVEALYNLTESTAGKWARKVFPVMATIFLLVLMVNLMKLIPGVESVGILHEVEKGQHGYPTISLGFATAIVKPPQEASGEAGSHGYNVIPFIRPASTDLSFTLTLALIAIVSVQIMGLQAGGFRYLGKFFNVIDFLKLWVKEKIGAFDLIMPFLNIFVGILELMAEIARIISFAFRLLGVMFAGAVLLFVMGSIFNVLQSAFLGLELFFGAIQAFVFAMLAVVFMTMATQIHGGHDEHAEAH